ncbi:MAG TPA: arginase family protein [Rhizobiaceae bacterium]|nr:arginase family protein [Rhizobiaceae bacterium]
MTRPLSIIGAPSSAGAYGPGQEKAPAAFRRHGLVEKLRAAGIDTHDRSDTPLFRWRPDLTNPMAMNRDAVADTAERTASLVAAALADGHAALVLGGDCTVELGTVASALRHGTSVGLVYIDFDADLNAPENSDGALDWTGVAHLLDIPGADQRLASLGPRRPMLGASDVLLLATENFTEHEAKDIADRNITLIPLAEVRRDPAAAANQAAAWAQKFDTVLVHLDVDVLSFAHFPIAENTRRCDGLRLAELGLLLEPLIALPAWRALTVTEVNPDHAPDEAQAFGELIAMLCDVLKP